MKTDFSSLKKEFLRLTTELRSFDFASAIPDARRERLEKRYRELKKSLTSLQSKLDFSFARVKSAMSRQGSSQSNRSGGSVSTTKKAAPKASPKAKARTTAKAAPKTSAKTSPKSSTTAAGKTSSRASTAKKPNATGKSVPKPARKARAKA